jgi:hypothetical protein
MDSIKRREPAMKFDMPGGFFYLPDEKQENFIPAFSPFRAIYPTGR